jgi:hypothetical protein
MTGRELVRLGRKIYGGRGWQTAMAIMLEVDTSTIRRWIATDRVPKSAELALKYLERNHESKSKRR